MVIRHSPGLSKREQQIMDVLFQANVASAKKIHQNIPDAPSYSAVRALLAKMEEKGLVKHKHEGKKYIYQAVQSKDDAGESAMQRLVKTFFAGSASRAITALLGSEGDKLTERELDELQKLIDQKKQR